MAAAETRPPKRWTEAARQFSIALRAEGLTQFRPAGKAAQGSYPRDSRGRLGNERRAFRLASPQTIAPAPLTPQSRSFPTSPASI